MSCLPKQQQDDLAWSVSVYLTSMPSLHFHLPLQQYPIYTNSIYLNVLLLWSQICYEFVTGREKLNITDSVIIVDQKMKNLISGLVGHEVLRMEEECKNHGNGQAEFIINKLFWCKTKVIISPSWIIPLFSCWSHKRE